MRLTLIVLSLLTVFFIFSCRHEIPVARGPVDLPSVSKTCSPDSVYFNRSILPLINASCAISGCHDPVTHKEDLVLNSYTGIMKIVRPGNASESKIYQVISTSNTGDIMPPLPHSPLSAGNIATIQKWINQGAQNNECVAACDTGKYSYSGEVSPIINTYCKGCHNPVSAGGGFDLSSYSNLKAVALSGKLMGSIRHAPGYKPMPQGTNKLSDCQITQIQRWIDSGTPQN